MDFLSHLPRALVVVAGLVLGLLLILLFNPPFSVCDAQKANFAERHTPFFIKDKAKKYVLTTGFEKAVVNCKNTNSAGGCLELFQGIKELVKDLELSSTKCTSELTKVSSYNKPLWETADLMVSLAWGERVPTDMFERLGWMGEYHVSLFCRIKKLVNRVGQSSKWDQFVEEKLSSLPGAAAAGRAKAWQMSLLSTNCKQVK